LGLHLALHFLGAHFLAGLADLLLDLFFEAAFFLALAALGVAFLFLLDDLFFDALAFLAISTRKDKHCAIM